MRTPYLNPFRVKLIGGEHPLARAAADINRRYPSPGGTRVGGSLFGGRFVDDAYVYPIPIPAAVP